MINEIQFAQNLSDVEVLIEMSGYLLKEYEMYQYFQEGATTPDAQASGVSAEPKPKGGLFKKMADMVTKCVNKAVSIITNRVEKKTNEDTSKKLENASEQVKQNPTLKDKMLRWAQKGDLLNYKGFDQRWADQVPRLREMLANFINTDTVKSPFGPGLERQVDELVKDVIYLGKCYCNGDDNARKQMNDSSVLEKFKKFEGLLDSPDLIAQLQMPEYKQSVDKCLEKMGLLTKILTDIRESTKNTINYLDQPQNGDGQSTQLPEQDKSKYVKQILAIIRGLLQSLTKFFLMKRANEWTFNAYYDVLNVNMTAPGSAFRNSDMPSAQQSRTNGNNPWSDQNQTENPNVNRGAFYDRRQKSDTETYQKYGHSGLDLYQPEMDFNMDRMKDNGLKGFDNGYKFTNFAQKNQSK